MQQTLHDHDILPTSKLKPALTLDTDKGKAMAFMKMHRHLILSGNPRHDRMVIVPLRALDQIREEEMAEPLAAMAKFHVDDVFYSMAIGRLRPVGR